MPGEASINQRSAREASAPCGGIPQVAPGVVVQLLQNCPVVIGNGGDAPQMVLVQVEKALCDLVFVVDVMAALFLHVCGEQPSGRTEVGDCL